jgi:hypothetical protein
MKPGGLMSEELEPKQSMFFSYNTLSIMNLDTELGIIC